MERPRRVTVASALLLVAAGLGLVRIGYLGFDLLDPLHGRGFHAMPYGLAIVIFAVLTLASLVTGFAGWRCLLGTRFRGVLVRLCAASAILSLCGCGFLESGTGWPRLRGFDYDMDPPSFFHAWVYAAEAVNVPITALTVLAAVVLLATDRSGWMAPARPVR